MPRVPLSVVNFSRAGTEVPDGVSGDAFSGHTVLNDGQTGLLVENSDAGAHEITFRLSRRVDGQPIVPRTEIVPGLTKIVFGPFPTGDYGTELEIDVISPSLSLIALRVG